MRCQSDQLLAKEGADVVTGLTFDGNGEAGIGENFETASSLGLHRLVGILDHMRASSCDNLHPLGGFGSKVVTPGQNHSQGFSLAGLRDDGVRNDLSVEIHIPFGKGRDIFEFHVVSIARFRESSKLYPWGAS